MCYPISRLLVGTVVMSLFCTGINNFNLSNDNVHDLTNLVAQKDILIDTVHDYLLEQEKRLATLRKHMEDYSKEHKRGIQKVARILSSVNQESSVNDIDERLKEKYVEGEANNSYPFEDIFPKYTSLCKGEILLHMDIQKHLKCRYVDHGIPFLKIAPFKEEEVFLDPRIVLYHDVIYEEEIKLLQRLSKPRLEVAEVINFDEDGHLKNETPYERMGQVAWIDDREHEHVKLLSRRVEHMTGLTTNSAEPLQIGYYEIGGFYFPHNDYIYKEELDFITYFKERGIANRIATVLFYLRLYGSMK
ncbi:prolyl 4-hydroxylase subunit alpha-1-like isoform X2 [Belonocnema kinseyi]|uniref:prolyl 4-hydroxylase subunit alpha-1-like isoform X2 n=1 Tax=Belonocnema kinseyi TaxID=2817044 RepID=UPI00143D6152|nr:prolyl 4-hydroxylase subunit alpha-1-like isoform X2 [Belonocnema kinseyi]